MSGVDPQNALVTKQDLQRIEKYVVNQSGTQLTGLMGAVQTGIDIYPKHQSTATLAHTIGTPSASYFICPRDQVVSSVVLNVTTAQTGAPTPTGQRFYICQPAAQDSLTLTVIGRTAANPAILALGLQNVALEAPVQLNAGQQYAVVYLVTAGTGNPAHSAIAATAAAYTLAPRHGFACLASGEQAVGGSFTAVGAGLGTPASAFASATNAAWYRLLA